MELMKFRKMLADGYAADEASLGELSVMLEKYPFFQAARVILLRSLYGKDNFDEALRENIIFIPDRRNLYSSLYEPKKELADIPETRSENRTVDLIDSFLNSWKDNEVPCEMPSDYTSYLLSMDDEKADEPVKFERGHDLIDNFIESGKIDMSSSDVEKEGESGDYSLDEENIDDVCFTETLAKIYIKQQRYDKALEIIRKLSLKYPKKNTYFANQLKTLEKLIINNKTKE